MFDNNFGKCAQGRRHGFASGGDKKILTPPLFGQWGDKILLR